MYLRLVCYMSWVKQGSEAMDFPPTFFKTNFLPKKELLKNFVQTFTWGPSINYVVSKSAIFDPLPPLVVFFIK